MVYLHQFPYVETCVSISKWPHPNLILLCNTLISSVLLIQLLLNYIFCGLSEYQQVEYSYSRFFMLTLNLCSSYRRKAPDRYLASPIPRKNVPSIHTLFPVVKCSVYLFLSLFRSGNNLCSLFPSYLVGDSLLKCSVRQISSCPLQDIIHEIQFLQIVFLQQQSVQTGNQYNFIHLKITKNAAIYQ